MILISVLAAALTAPPCPLCTPDGRMAVLAAAGAKSFDSLEAPGRTLLRAMAVDASGRPSPVVTLIRTGSRAEVEVAGAPGSSFAKPISHKDFDQAEDEVKGLKDDVIGPACGGRTVSVQFRVGMGAMSAIANQGCNAKIERVAEDLAALAFRAAPECVGAADPDAFKRLTYCLMQRHHPATTIGPNRIQ
jgi:hypothetical protein